MIKHVISKRYYALEFQFDNFLRKVVIQKVAAESQVSSTIVKHSTFEYVKKISA